MFIEDSNSDTIILKNTSDFSQVYEMIRSHDFNKNISIDKLSFILPHHILMLVQYFILQKKDGIEGLLLGAPSTGGYLKAIHLVDFCNTNYKTPRHIPGTSTAMPIMRIDITSLEDYKLHFESFLSAFCNGKDLSLVKLCIDELVNNVYDHSESEIDAFIFCQYYSMTNKFRFAISDIGIGIPEKINQYYPDLKLTSTDALKHALEKGVSTKSRPYNRGYGLDNLLAILRGINAEAEIYSSDAYGKLNTKGTMYYSLNPIKHFKGTIVQITINVSMLQDKDEDIVNEFDYN
jgi:hypothetical protein